MNEVEWIISVDDHLIEPPDTWVSRLPRKLADVAPRVVRDDGGEAWVYEDTRRATSELYSVLAQDTENHVSRRLDFATMRRGCFDPQARVEDMNRGGILASLCFPTLPRFCGQLFWEAKDRELAMLCVKAYNDFMCDEWAGSSPGRLIPLIIIPLWDPIAAAAEIERCVANGAKGFSFPENPAALGLPSIHDRGHYWDPVFDVANETGLPICIHAGSGSRPTRTSDDANIIIGISWAVPVLPSGTLLDWLYSGNLQQFPRLKICLSEGGIGWMSYVLERAQQCYDHQSAVWEPTVAEGTRCSLALAEGFNAKQLFQQHVYGCFIHDYTGMQDLDNLGVENVMIEVDYPHGDTSWPNCREVATAQLASRSMEDAYKITQGNAQKVFNFVPSAPQATSG